MTHNKRVNILRPSGPTGLGSIQASEMFKSDITAFVKFKSVVFFNVEGREMISDGEWMFDTSVEVKAGDVLEIFPNTEKKYKVESVEEIHNVQGTLLGYKGMFSRDNALE